MVQLQQPFDARAVAPQSKPEPIEEGWYPVIMVASDLKPTQAGDGGYFELIFDIIDGQYKGRKLYARLNVYNNNEDAVRIAQGQLSALCWVTNVYPLQDTQQLHNIPLQAFVVKRRNERDGGMSNDVKGFRDINGKEPWKENQQGQPQQQPQSAPQSGGWNQPPAQPPAQAGGWQNPPPGGPAPGQPASPAGGAPNNVQTPSQGGWQGQPPAGQPQTPQQPPSQFQQGNGQWGGQQQPQQPQQGQPEQPAQQPWQGGNAPTTPPWQNR